MSAGRRRRRTADDWTDDRDLSDRDNQPPNHGKPTHGPTRFLIWVGRLDRDVDVSDLGDLYQEWVERQDTGEQADLGRWDNAE